MYDAKLQHVLGLALSRDGNILFVADSYNHKIKKVDVNKNAVTTLVGPIYSDATDGNSNSAFNEPAGLCVGGSNLVYVADTNNHAIKVLEFTDNYLIKNVRNLDLKLEEATPKISDKKLTRILSKPVEVSSKGGKLILSVSLKFESDLKLTEQAPQKWSLELPNLMWSSVPSNGSNVEYVDSVINLSPSSEKDNFVNFVFNIVTCTPNTCLPKSFIVCQPIRFINNGPTSIEHKINVCVGPNNLDIC